MSLPILLFYGFAFLGIVHSFIFTFVAVRNKKTADLIITLFLFIQSLIILEYVFFWTGLNNPYHYLCNISLTLQFLFGPLLLMYVDYLFNEEKNIRKYIIHFIPAAVILILMLPYYFSTADLKLNHYKMIKYLILDMRYVVYAIMAHMTFYFVLIMSKVIKEKRVGHIRNWLLTILGLFGFYIACYISYYIMIRFPWFNLTTDYFVSIGMCASIIFIIYFAYGRKKIMDGFPVAESLNLENIYFSYQEDVSSEVSIKKQDLIPTSSYSVDKGEFYKEIKVLSQYKEINTIEKETAYENNPLKYKNSGLTTEVANELAEALKQLMQKEKLYRESELKLETLATKLNVARHYVSQVINQYYSVNFFEYINLLRIEEAKQLLISTDRKSMNIIEVAYSVGYNTKNTFNAAFRRIVGVTPTEYRNQKLMSMN